MLPLRLPLPRTRPEMIRSSALSSDETDVPALASPRRAGRWQAGASGRTRYARYGATRYGKVYRFGVRQEAAQKLGSKSRTWPPTRSSSVCRS